MSDLDIPGARLHFGAHGRGPLLVLVPGATGSAISFAKIAPLLRADYTVVAYDRRGFSRSMLAGPQDDDDRLATDADDVRRLIEHLGDEPAIVVGASSGAIVALEVLTRHPSVVRLVVPFEPPAVRLLVDGQRWVDFFHEVYDLHQQSVSGRGTGPPPGLPRRGRGGGGLVGRAGCRCGWGSEHQRRARWSRGVGDRVR